MGMAYPNSGEDTGYITINGRRQSIWIDATGRCHYDNIESTNMVISVCYDQPYDLDIITKYYKFGEAIRIRYRYFSIIIRKFIEILIPYKRVKQGRVRSWTGKNYRSCYATN